MIEWYRMSLRCCQCLCQWVQEKFQLACLILSKSRCEEWSVQTRPEWTLMREIMLTSLVPRLEFLWNLKEFASCFTWNIVSLTSGLFTTSFTLPLFYHPFPNNVIALDPLLLSWGLGLRLRPSFRLMRRPSFPHIRSVAVRSKRTGVRFLRVWTSKMSFGPAICLPIARPDFARRKSQEIQSHWLDMIGFWLPRLLHPGEASLAPTVLVDISTGVSLANQQRSRWSSFRSFRQSSDAFLPPFAQMFDRITAKTERPLKRFEDDFFQFFYHMLFPIDCIFCFTFSSFSLAHKIWLSAGSEFLQRHHFRWPGLAGLSMLHDAARLPLLSSSFRSVECWGCRVCRGLASKAGWLLHAACGSCSAASLVVQTWFCFLCLQASRCVACVSRVWVVCVSCYFDHFASL